MGKVNKLFVFGSILTNRFNDDSDVDLVVSFNKAEVGDYFDNYFDFKYALEELFGREVDLLEEQIIKNPCLKKNVDATIYDLHFGVYQSAKTKLYHPPKDRV